MWQASKAKALAAREAAAAAREQPRPSRRRLLYGDDDRAVPPRYDDFGGPEMDDEAYRKMLSEMPPMDDHYRGYDWESRYETDEFPHYGYGDPYGYGDRDHEPASAVEPEHPSAVAPGVNGTSNGTSVGSCRAKRWTFPEPSKDHSPLPCFSISLRSPPPRSAKLNDARRSVAFGASRRTKGRTVRRAFATASSELLIISSSEKRVDL